MKKTALTLFTVYAIVAVSVFSCQKSYNARGPQMSLNQQFAGLRTAPQGLSVQAGRDTVVFGAKGTMMHFYTNSFKYANGSIITSGTVYLQLIEMYKPGDMIANRATTTANGQPLSSGGQVSIVASMNGQEVFANKYGIGFKQPGASSEAMELFFGSTGNTDSLAVWTAGNNTTPGTTAATTTVDSTRLPYSAMYVFDSCTSFNFVNCDHAFTSGSSHIYTNIIFPDSTFNLQNTQVYICMPAFNSVVGNSDHFFVAATATINGSFYAPPGTAYKLVAIANKGQTMYYFESSGTVPSDTLKVSAAMATDTQSDILARLSGL